MSQNITLRNGEIAVVIGNASIIMNVDTAFEVAEKLIGRVTCLAGLMAGAETKDINKNEVKPKMVDHLNDIDREREGWRRVLKAMDELPEDEDEDQVDTETEAEPEQQAPRRPGKDPIPVIAFTFDLDAAIQANDVRAGIGRYIGEYGSCAEAEIELGVSQGRVSAIKNAWNQAIEAYKRDKHAFAYYVNGQRNFYNGSGYNYNNLGWANVIGVRKADRAVFFAADNLPDFVANRLK